METKKTHGGKREGSGRTNDNSVAYKTTLPKAKLDKFLEYYPKLDLNKCLKDFIDLKIAEAEKSELLT
jgi:hypothetical protein